MTEINNTHIRAVVTYEMVGDLPGPEWAAHVLDDAVKRGAIESYRVTGTYVTYFAEAVDFYVDIPIEGMETMDSDAAKKHIRPTIERIVGESDVQIRYVTGVVHPDPSKGAMYGQGYLVKAEYNTEADGTPVDESVPGEYPTTLHGPFDSESGAMAWANDFMPDDTDIHDVTVITFNKVQ